MLNNEVEPTNSKCCDEEADYYSEMTEPIYSMSSLHTDIRSVMWFYGGIRTATGWFIRLSLERIRGECYVDALYSARQSQNIGNV